MSPNRGEGLSTPAPRRWGSASRRGGVARRRLAAPDRGGAGPPPPGDGGPPAAGGGWRGGGWRPRIAGGRVPRPRRWKPLVVGAVMWRRLGAHK